MDGGYVGPGCPEYGWGYLEPPPFRSSFPRGSPSSLSGAYRPPATSSVPRTTRLPGGLTPGAAGARGVSPGSGCAPSRCPTGSGRGVPSSGLGKPTTGQASPPAQNPFEPTTGLGTEVKSPVRGPARQALDPNLRELSPGVNRSPAENAEARAFYRNNRSEAIRRYQVREGKEWPPDESGRRERWAEHPRPLANGGDPLYVVPGEGPDPNARHCIPGPDGLTDHQRWGAMGGRARWNIRELTY